MSRLGPCLRAIVLVCLSSWSAAQAGDSAKAPRFVASESCAGCHEDETDGWRTSHHAFAWKEADGGSVLGDFEEAVFAHNGAVTRFTRDGPSYRVETDHGGGLSTRTQVIGTAGIAPLQQYLVETEPGRLQALDIAWEAINNRWYNLYPDQRLRPGDGFHWSGPYKNWNARCAECHATDFQKNYDPSRRRYDSTQAEIGVGCEACHGPGEAHIAWAQDPEIFERNDWSGVDARGLAHVFEQDDPEAEIQQCAGCHSRREPLGDRSPPPGTAFHDAYALALLRDGLYHPDGQILDKVYVYGSFLQSRMYARGVRCSNCHNPHAATLKTKGNGVCTQCHSPAGNRDFPTLTLKNYDAPAHHFHEPGSTGAQCQNCHMIERVYMGIDGRRDHSFRIPRPDLSVELGTPNACTDCHADRTPEWAAAAVATWFPDSPSRGNHFATALATAWRGNGGPQTLGRLVDVALDQDQGGFVRASVLQALARYPSAGIAERTTPLLQDDSPLVRATAIPLQRPASPALRLKRVAPLLEDSAKAVRIAAVRGLLDLLAAGHAPPSAESARSALQEYHLSLIAKADFPETQMAMAGTALTFRQFAEAERAFAEAVRIDPQLVDAWVMLARLRAATGQRAEARAILGKALGFNPDNALLARLLSEF